MNRKQTREVKPEEALIYLGFCHPGMVHTGFMESILGCLGEFRLIVNGAEGGPLISRARNMLLERFLRTDADYLLMADTDVVFTPTDVRLLLKARKPIVGALYYGILGGNPESTFPVALTVQDGVLQSLDKIPESLERVDAVGMGLTLIERRVVEALDPHSGLNRPFAEKVYNGRHHGEDAVFCLEAKKAGYDTWLEPAARVGHIKEIVL